MKPTSSTCPASPTHHQPPFPVRFHPIPQVLLLLIAVLLAVLVAGCDLATTPSPAPTAAPPSPTPAGALPAFSDWRLAYVGQDGKLHVVTQDGKTDLAGLQLTASTTSLWGQIAIAPDGRAFTYADKLINLRPGAPGYHGMQDIQAYTPTRCWAPDNTRVAYQAQESWDILTLGSDTPTVIPGTQGLRGELIGWLDQDHLAASIPTGDPVTSYTLSSLDIATGTLSKIASISANSLGVAAYSLSPDGSEILLTNHGGEGLGDYTPIVEVIETKTGQKHRLPTITATAPSVGVIAWKPGTHLVLAFSGDPSDSHNASGVLLDVGQDTVTRFAPGVFPLGWAPDTGALFISTQSGTRTSATSPVSFQVSTMAALPPATASQPVFNVSSVSFPFLGFMRTA